MPHHPHRKKLQQKSQQKEDTGEGIRTWMQIRMPSKQQGQAKGLMSRCHCKPQKKKLQHFENKEAGRERETGLNFFERKKKDPKTALIKPNYFVNRCTHNHQPSTPNKSNPAEISEFKAARRGFFCLSSDGRTCLYSSFAGTPPHRWECRAGSYSSFRTALISPDIIPFLHNGRKGHKK